MSSGSSGRDHQASLHDPNAAPNFDARPEWGKKQIPSESQTKATVDGGPAADSGGSQKLVSTKAKKQKPVNCSILFHRNMLTVAVKMHYIMTQHETHRSSLPRESALTGGENE